MSLSRKIAGALGNLGVVLGGGGGAAQTVAASEGPHHLELEVHVASPVGVELGRLEFRADGPTRTLDQLTAWADRLAARITYLMEPMVVIEVRPPRRGTACGRSTRPGSTARAASGSSARPSTPSPAPAAPCRSSSRARSWSA
jgi:hypothetical protein